MINDKVRKADMWPGLKKSLSLTKKQLKFLFVGICDGFERTFKRYAVECLLQKDMTKLLNYLACIFIRCFLRVSLISFTKGTACALSP